MTTVKWYTWQPTNHRKFSVLAIQAERLKEVLGCHNSKPLPISIWRQIWGWNTSYFIHSSFTFQVVKTMVFRVAARAHQGVYIQRRSMVLDKISMVWDIIELTSYSLDRNVDMTKSDYHDNSNLGVTKKKDFHKVNEIYLSQKMDQ